MESEHGQAVIRWLMKNQDGHLQIYADMGFYPAIWKFYA